MKRLGVNVVRVHLQLGKFMDGPDKPNGKTLDRLGKLLQLAERLRLYLDLTGLGCYHKKDVPAWYDKLSEKDRWAVQARFWQAVVARTVNGWGLHLGRNTSSSLSPWTRQTGPGPTSPGGGFTNWRPPSA